MMIDAHGGICWQLFGTCMSWLLHLHKNEVAAVDVLKLTEVVDSRVS
jgi:hypothetical protein